MKTLNRRTFGSLLTVALAATLGFAGACTQKAADDTKSASAAAFERTKAATDRALEATKKGAAIAIATTGEAITDGWITTKLKAKFADETPLKGSSISVETNDHVVTLSGSVPSQTANTRAADIARGTEGVTRLVNHLLVVK